MFSRMSEKSTADAPFEHELSLEQLFSQTFSVMRKNYSRVLPIFAALGVVSTAISTYISYVTPSLSITSLSNITSAQLGPVADKVGQILGLNLANFFLSWFLLYFAAGIGIWQMNRKSFASVEQQGRSMKLNYFNLAVTTLLAVMIIEAGLFLILVGALIFGTILYLSLAACTLEGKPPFASLGRSRQLVSGRWFKTFALLISVQALVYLISSVLGDVVSELPLASPEGTLISVAVQNFAMALLFPMVSASMLVLYHSRQQARTQVVKPPPSPYEYMKPEPFGVFSGVQRKYCPHCGTQLTLDEKYCHNCGTLQP
jgi:uncharacterized Tic20 family protein